jgi:CheY-like chemotaxis protein
MTGGLSVIPSPPIMLISDDDRAFRKTLEGVFAPLGFHTLSAADGDEALQIIEREAVHLLLTDMHMPRMTGLEIIREVRHARLGLPCILISAGVDDELLRQAKSVDAFSVLSKPVRYPEITGVVADAMRSVYGWVGEDSQ